MGAHLFTILLQIQEEHECIIKWPNRPEQALGTRKKAVFFIFFSPPLTTLVATIHIHTLARTSMLSQAILDLVPLAAATSRTVDQTDSDPPPPLSP
jgi:hypothetical protein